MIEIKDLYFDYLLDKIDGEYFKVDNYIRTLEYLYHRDFYWSIPMDENRYSDGMDLRDRFIDWYCDEFGSTLSLTEIYDNFNKNCNVLEVMVALALRCEEDIMSDSYTENCTGKWFAEMFDSLGLTFMDDSSYDEECVNYIVTRFLNRKYERNGKGGLFTVPNIEYDLRDVEIWYQLNWYLNYILEGE